MSYYDQRDSYINYARRHSNSFSEEQTGARRKKPRFSGKRGGNNAQNRNISTDNHTFRELSNPHKRLPSHSSPVSQGRQSFGRDNPFRSPQSIANQGYFDRRELPDFVEPQHSGTPWNWDNYFGDCKNWQDKHKLAYYRSRCLALEFENQMLFEQIGSLVEENCVFAAERGVTPSMRVPEMPARGFRQMERGPLAQSSNAQSPPKKQGKNRQTSDSSDSELEFEITEDMMAFLEKSIRHKLSLKKKKTQVAKKSKEAEVLKTKEVELKKQGPKLPTGQKRKEELDQLYGANSTVIHGLETSVLLSFNRNCDTYKPELWMAVPLNAETIVP